MSKSTSSSLQPLGHRPGWKSIKGFMSASYSIQFHHNQYACWRMNGTAFMEGLLFLWRQSRSMEDQWSDWNKDEICAKNSWNWPEFTSGGYTTWYNSGEIRAMPLTTVAQWRQVSFKPQIVRLSRNQRFKRQDFVGCGESIEKRGRSSYHGWGMRMVYELSSTAIIFHWKKPSQSWRTWQRERGAGVRGSGETIYWFKTKLCALPMLEFVWE